ncbi:hypothetical protein FORC13_p045 (plasmid) [Bacillus cereus]|uniref:toxin Cry1Ac domain D-VI-related protein n=1 Tax=Bacillus cereus TaxID=1396 RepID=UPI000744B4AB|nr:toxin Cry1Ac domain D-VI-related protein [Bacillus cereus]ALZ64530.1 hypothetical protein FORC13_p045 [Bacillus cereus]
MKKKVLATTAASTFAAYDESLEKQQEVALKAVNDLFRDKEKNDLKDGIDHNKIAEVKEKVNALLDSEEKTILWYETLQAEWLLDSQQEKKQQQQERERQEAVLKAVNDLFRDKEKNDLKDGIDHNKIAEVKEKVNALLDSEEKTILWYETSQAEWLLENQ